MVYPIKRPRLVNNWRRKLTHGYSAWGIYISIGLTACKDSFDLVSSLFPWWVPVVLFVAVLASALIKQESVSGADT